MKNQIFKRSRKKWQNDEAAALADVLKIQQLQSADLEAQHDDKQFVWVRSVEFSYAKDQLTEKHAIGNALNDSGVMQHALSRHDTETHYVFRKIQE